MTATPSAATVARIEAAMLDTCEINEPGTLGAYDADTNEHPQVAGALVWTGACMVSEASRGSSTATQTRGNEPEVEHPYQVSIPRAVAPTPGQIVTITAVHDDSDPELVDTQFVIRRVRVGTRGARRILLCDLYGTVAQ